MKRTLFFIIILSVTVSSLMALEDGLFMKGEIFRQGSSQKDLLYIQKEFRAGNSFDGTISHKYFSPDNRLAAFETVQFDKGRISFYETAISERGFSGSLQFDNEMIKIQRVVNGEIKVKNMKAKDNLIVGPMLPSFVKGNFKKLTEGNTLNFHLPYFDRMTFVPMIIEKKDNQSSTSHSSFSVEMKLKNRFLSLFIDPIEMVLDAVTGDIMEIHGTTILPDPAETNSNKFVDTNIYYNYGGSE